MFKRFRRYLTALTEAHQDSKQPEPLYHLAGSFETGMDLIELSAFVKECFASGASGMEFPEMSVTPYGRILCAAIETPKESK